MEKQKVSPIQVMVTQAEREIYKEASALKAEELGVKRLYTSHYLKYLADKDVERLRKKHSDTNNK